jgi:hypothetical protein
MVPEINSFVLDVEDKDSLHDAEIREGRAGTNSRGVQEDDFIGYSKRFLAYVHVKNPILDVARFKADVRKAAEDGPRWDGRSCVVVRLEFYPSSFVSANSRSSSHAHWVAYHLHFNEILPWTELQSLQAT